MRPVLAALALVLLAAPAAGGDLKLEFHPDGTVTLIAQDVPARQILNEWAKRGQVRLVNADKVAGTSLTLELLRVPEKRALETLLRSASGYVLAPRRAGVPGPSQFDRIMVMPPSVASAAPPRAMAPPPTLPPQPPAPEPPPGMEEDTDEPPAQAPQAPQPFPGQPDVGMPGAPGVQTVPPGLQGTPGQQPLRPFITPAEPAQPGGQPQAPRPTILRTPGQLPNPQPPPQ